MSGASNTSEIGNCCGTTCDKLKIAEDIRELKAIATAYAAEIEERIRRDKENMYRRGKNRERQARLDYIKKVLKHA